MNYSYTYNNIPIDLQRKFFVNIFRFSWKRIRVQPIQQRNTHSQANLRILRSMNMTVAKARREKLELGQPHFGKRVPINL